MKVSQIHVMVAIVIAVIVSLMPLTGVYASLESNGPNGIDARGLGLTGNGVGIGMVEESRPSDPSFDTNGALFSTLVDPAGVFFTRKSAILGTITHNATANLASETNALGGHSTLVAGVMISTGLTSAGTSPQAMLFGGGDAPGILQDAVDLAAVDAQHIVTRNNGDIAAMNMSFGFQPLPGELGDGTSTISSFIDWSASFHDTLYVIAGAETNNEGYLFVDTFNGIVVGFSQKNNGVYRQVHTGNVSLPNPFSPLSERSYIDILAPGDNINMSGPGNGAFTASGTSYAAPHVTGTVALLQEHANTQIGNSVPGWGPLAKRHQVMKAVMMNSADKVSGRLGSTRTVLKKNGDTWDQSDADRDDFIPLDEEMGAGHLNVSRALTQYSSGAQGPNGVPVPLIGWDYDSTDFDGDINKYVLNQELVQDSYISITLAWDREVTFSIDGGAAGVFDSGDEFNGYSEVDADDVINDLTLHLMAKGAGPFDDPIWSSAQDYMPLEHLFVPIFDQGEYEIWVEQTDDDLGGGQEYGIAWWAEGTGPLLSGDFDNDNDVDGADFLVWQLDTSVGDLADWQSEYGMTSAITASTAVPEPSCLLLLVLGLPLLLGRRGKL